MDLAARHTTTSERHWKNLKKAFEEAYIDSGEKLMAHSQLGQLKMMGGDVDAYIATFNHLIKTAGFSSTDLRTIIMFRNGPNSNLH